MRLINGARPTSYKHISMGISKGYRSFIDNLIIFIYCVVKISMYVESRFNKDRINCVTNTFVTKVDETVLHTRDAVSNEQREIPFGMCVWAAGIAPRPLTKSIIDKVEGQTNRLTRSYFCTQSFSFIHSVFQFFV